MDNLLDNLGRLIVEYPSWKYLIIGGGMILQGEIAILVLTYLVLNHDLSWREYIFVGPTILLIAETLLYLGARILRQTRFGWRLYKKIKPNRRLQFYLFYLRKNLVKLFIVSKFLPATNFVLFFLTGWSKTRFGLFLKSYLASLVIWFTTMTAIAYFLVSGLYYLKAEKILRHIELGIVAFVILIFVVEYLLKKILKKFIALHEKAESIGSLLGDEKETKENPESVITDSGDKN